MKTTILVLLFIIVILGVLVYKSFYPENTPEKVKEEVVYSIPPYHSFAFPNYWEWPPISDYQPSYSYSYSYSYFHVPYFTYGGGSRH